MAGSRSPTLAEVFRVALEAARQDIHTAIPGKVVRYDSTKQLVDVQPLIKIAYTAEDDSRQIESLPVIPNCPVAFQGGGGFSITYPLVVGDTGLLVFAESSLDKWLALDGREVDPGIDHRHHLADGVFIPGVQPFGKSRSATGGGVQIGTDGGSLHPAAYGDDVKSYLGLLKTWLTGLAGAVVYSTPYTASVPPVTGIVSTDVKIT